MKELKGSEKQIKWANDIRKDMLEGIKILDIYKNYANDIEDVELGEMVLSFADTLKNRIAEETKATWFINNRFLFEDTITTTDDLKRYKYKTFNMIELEEFDIFVESGIDRYDFEEGYYELGWKFIASEEFFTATELV